MNLLKISYLVERFELFFFQATFSVEFVGTKQQGPEECSDVCCSQHLKGSSSDCNRLNLRSYT